VTRLDGPHGLEPERHGPTAGHRATDGLDQEAHVIAAVDLRPHLPSEPVALGQDRRPSRAGSPRERLELVDLVAGGAAEALGELAVALSQQMDHDQVGALRVVISRSN